jgi:hypothetical protein
VGLDGFFGFVGFFGFSGFFGFVGFFVPGDAGFAALALLAS